MRRRARSVAEAVQAFLARHAIELAITTVAALVAILVSTFLSHEWGIALVVAVPIGAALAIAYTEGAHREQLRQRRRAAIQQEERERQEMRRIAELAREILLETTIWTDVDELGAWVQAGRWQPSHELRPPREWTVAAVVGRGREEIDAFAIGGWSTMAQLLRDHAQRLTDMIDQEFPGQPAERRSELRTVFRAVEAAASAADDLAGVRERAIASRWGTPEEKRAADDALSAAADLFYGACEWIDGQIGRIEPTDELLAAIDESKAWHRQDAAVRAAARRELQAIAARAAGDLLRDAAPSAAYLARSTLGREGTLQDMAADEGFAFASEDELAALPDWRARVGSAQRAFALAVEGRGWDMSRTTLSLWVRVNSDGINELENAILGLQTDLARVPTPADASDVAKIIERSRERLRGAVRLLVEHIGRLEAHEAR